jgi:two-component system nitrogen regulation sensor histidine kinase NtrY
VTFRAKLFWIFTLMLIVSVGLIAGAVTLLTRKAFEELNEQHTAALVQQFQNEIDRRKTEVLNRVGGVAEEESTTNMAMNLAMAQPDVSKYVDVASGVAKAHQLDILDFLSNDGTIISSAEWPARFGYKIDWVKHPQDFWTSAGAFWMKMDTQDGAKLALVMVRVPRVGDKDLYVVGGERLDNQFLKSFVLPEGMRAMLYINLGQAFQPDNLLDASGPASQADRFSSIIENEQQSPSVQTARIQWTADASSAEVFHAIPLQGRENELLGLLLVGNSQYKLVMLERRILWSAIAVGVIGFFFSALLSWWGAARVTRPVRRLAEGAREVSEGNWGARVEVRGGGEVGQLAQAFNRMTQQLIDQRERLVQAERVAAWRELARRLAHELKNPLFPLQTTVENMQRAKEKNPELFEDVFRESTGILISEIENLKKITGRFSDFAKMPPPELSTLNLNDVVRAVVKLFEAQFGAVGRPPITPELHLEENLPSIQADQTMLHRAIENLVLNAMDAMPAGGVLMLRTSHQNGNVHLEISDTGTGLTPEECERLFTPYYTTKQHGTGLGLAIVQSVVSDHGGRISVESESGVGTSFHIDLPSRPPQRPTHPSSAPELEVGKGA